jgi:hypothetical protein
MYVCCVGAGKHRTERKSHPITEARLQRPVWWARSAAVGGSGRRIQYGRIVVAAGGLLESLSPI